MPAKRLDLINRQFGSLIVESLDHVHKKFGTMWGCRCSCGNLQTVRGSHLTGGTIYRCTTCKTRASRNPNGVGDMSIHYWNQVIRGAERRDIGIEITAEEAYKVFLAQERNCALTGIPIKFPDIVNDRDQSTASLDRIDSNFGYTKSNIQWVHKTINRMKMNMDEDEFVRWCSQVCDYKQNEGKPK